MKTKDEILQLWLDWVEENGPDADSDFVGSYCFFCGETGSPPKHKPDCIYKLTEDYSRPIAEESE